MSDGSPYSRRRAGSCYCIATTSRPHLRQSACRATRRDVVVVSVCGREVVLILERFLSLHKVNVSITTHAQCIICTTTSVNVIDVYSFVISNTFHVWEPISRDSNAILIERSHCNGLLINAARLLVETIETVNVKCPMRLRNLAKHSVTVVCRRNEVLLQLTLNDNDAFAMCL